jgi:hypothetical protein
VRTDCQILLRPCSMLSYYSVHAEDVRAVYSPADISRAAASSLSSLRLHSVRATGMSHAGLN